VAASGLATGEVEAETAAARVIGELHDGLAGGRPGCILWFAKGYGARASPLGRALREQFPEAVVVGSTSEGGIISSGTEAQNETFAFAALALAMPGIRAYPFHTEDLGSLPELGRGGRWADLSSGRSSPCVLAFSALPDAGGHDPQSWLGLLDRALAPLGGQGPADSLPVVVGGLTVGNHVHVDGQEHRGGGFGLVLHAVDPSVHFNAVVCQGAAPFGPWISITGVHDGHVITGLDGRNPQEVVRPLLAGPDVPGEGQAMAGVFVDPTPDHQLPGPAAAALAAAALGGRPNCLVRPLHAFTPEGHLLLSPLADGLPYAAGMQLQLHCMSSRHVLEDVASRAELDVVAHGGVPPDAAIVISCGVRGLQMHGEEGVESRTLQRAWGRPVPTLGFFAGGEIGPVGLKTYLHGYTTSCLTLRGGDA